MLLGFHDTALVEGQCQPGFRDSSLLLGSRALFVSLALLPYSFPTLLFGLPPPLLSIPASRAFQHPSSGCNRGCQRQRGNTDGRDDAGPALLPHILAEHLVE